MFWRANAATPEATVTDSIGAPKACPALTAGRDRAPLKAHGRKIAQNERQRPAVGHDIARCNADGIAHRGGQRQCMAVQHAQHDPDASQRRQHGHVKVIGTSARSLLESVDRQLLGEIPGLHDPSRDIITGIGRAQIRVDDMCPPAAEVQLQR